jgi:serine protease AprX
MFGMMRKDARFVALFAVAFLILNFAAPAMALNEVVDIIHVRNLWTAEWMAPNGTMMNGVTGKGVGVAISDTGVDGTHGDLINRVICNVKWMYNDWMELPDTDVYQGHGTACAGIICADGSNSGGLYKGVAPNASLIGLSWDFVGGQGGYTDCDDVWIYENALKYNIKIVSVSIEEGDITNDIEVKNIIERNILYSYAACNSGGDGTNDNVGNHQDNRGILSVGGCMKDLSMWNSSSRGDRKNVSTWPSVVAPQNNIVVPLAKTGLLVATNVIYDPVLLAMGYVLATTGGTSACAPQVAGVSALVFQVCPNLTPAQVKQIIELTADPIFGLYEETGWFAGHGLVNGTRAVAVAHYMTLRPDSSIEDALKYYRIGWNGETMVLNPLPLPEISVIDKIEKSVTPGFECAFLILGICATLTISRKRR